MTPGDADILDAVRAAFSGQLPSRIGVAVSGGSDSLALLHVLAMLARGTQTTLHAATVDHGLRPEAAAEAAHVARVAADLGVAHDTLHWRGWTGQGNLQDAARRARQDLLTRWAAATGISVLAFGHTADDQAETVLMRLGRAAGANGLAGIPRRRLHDGIVFLRPCLGLRRADLRAYLDRQGIAWVDDPSNEDPRFDRVRVRQAMPVLETLGIGVDALAAVADNMADVREALDWYTFLAARDMVQIDGGDVLIDRRSFRTLPQETARRLLGHALVWIGCGGYAPRRAALAGALEAIRRGRTMTLQGCVILHRQGLIWIGREAAAVAHLSATPPDPWDGRWRAAGAPPPGCVIRPLGETGLRQAPHWRDTGRPRAALLATPGLWSGGDLLSAPLAGLEGGYGPELADGPEGFFASILSH